MSKAKPKSASDASEALKLTPQHVGAYYVYQLVDPRDNSVFYVGKGKGDRIKIHAKNARLGRIDNAPKHQMIQSIHCEGLDVIERVVSYHETSASAYKAEREMIAELKSAGLTNIAGGFVTNKEKFLESVKSLLARMKPFSEWVAGVTDVQRSDAMVVGGSMDGAYQFIRGNLEYIIECESKTLGIMT